MGYTYFAETHDGRQASVDNRYNRTYTRTFIVRTDNPGYGPYYAGSHPSLPLIWTRHPEDPYAFCLKLSPTQDAADPLQWRVTAEYGYPDFANGTGNPAVDTQQQGYDPGERAENPLLRPRDYQVSTTTYPWAVWKDRLGNSIKNTAGDPFLPPVEIQRMGCNVTVGLNQIGAPNGFWLSAVGYVNASSMIIGPYSFATAQVRLDSVSAQRVFENNVGYWRWTLVWQYKPTWAVELLNQGRRELVTYQDGGPGGPIVTELVDIYDKTTGYKVDNPVPLARDGTRLDPGALEIFLSFDVFPRAAFPAVI